MSSPLSNLARSTSIPHAPPKRAPIPANAKNTTSKLTQNPSRALPDDHSTEFKQNPSHVNSSSPLKAKRTVEFAVIEPKLSSLRMKHAIDMDGKWIKMDADTFMDNFFPLETEEDVPPTSHDSMFSSLNGNQLEKPLQNQFVSNFFVILLA